MVVGFTTTYAISGYHHWCCEFESRSGRGVQHYVIKFVSDLRQVGGFLRDLLFPPPIFDWWMLFQKSDVCTKLYIYLLIKCLWKSIVSQINSSEIRAFQIWKKEFESKTNSYLVFMLIGNDLPIDTGLLFTIATSPLLGESPIITLCWRNCSAWFSLKRYKKGLKS